jgi:hypothetical protein
MRIRETRFEVAICAWIPALGGLIVTYLALVSLGLKVVRPGGFAEWAFENLLGVSYYPLVVLLPILAFAGLGCQVRS